MSELDSRISFEQSVFRFSIYADGKHFMSVDGFEHLSRIIRFLTTVFGSSEISINIERISE